jgi:hypothetical protein
MLEQSHGNTKNKQKYDHRRFRAYDLGVCCTGCLQYHTLPAKLSSQGVIVYSVVLWITPQSPKLR